MLPIPGADGPTQSTHRSRSFWCAVGLCLAVTMPLTALAQPQQQELLAALRLGSVEGVQAALAAGADPDARDPSGWTPLMLAVAQRDLSIMEVLLAAGADIEAVDEGGRTALIEAAFGGSPPVVRLLLEAGADPDVRDAFGRTARSLAVSLGHQAVVSQIDAFLALRTASQADAEAEARAAAQAELRALASQADGLRQARLRADLAAQPRIFLAIARDTPPATVREALELGADVTVLDDFGQSPLMYAAAGNVPEVIGLLLAAGADPDYATETGWTAVMIALRDNPDPAAVRALASAPQDLLARNEDGATVLELAVQRGDPELVMFLNGLLTGQGPAQPAGPVDGALLPPADGAQPQAPVDTPSLGQVPVTPTPATPPPVTPPPVTPPPVTPPPATPATPVGPVAPAAPSEASAATRALVTAILNGGTVADAQLAIHEGADVRSPYFSQTPLNWAIERDRRDIARLLVAAGARQSGGAWQPCGFGPGQVQGRVQAFLQVDEAGQVESFMNMIDGFLWELQRRPALRRTSISVEQAIMGLSSDSGPLDALLALAVAWTGIDGGSFDAQGRMVPAAREALYRFTFTDADGSLYSRRTAVSEASQRLLERAIAMHVGGGRVGGC